MAATHRVNPTTGSFKLASSDAITNISTDAEELSANVLRLRVAHPDFRADTTQHNGDTYHYYRRGCFIKCTPSELTKADKEAIRVNFEQGRRENGVNLRVKELFADVITDQLRGSEALVVDVGCGEHPIFDFFEGTADGITFAGIEQNDALVKKHHRMGNNVTNWATVMNDNTQYPKNTPHIATSVYALGLMVNGKLGKRISKILGDEGQGSFYVGNFYLDSQERETGKTRERLSGILERANLSFTRIADPASRSNEFWVITHASDNTTNSDVSDILESKLQLEASGGTFKLNQPPQPAIREHRPRTGGGVRRLGRLQAG